MFSVIENADEMTLEEAKDKNETDIKKVLQKKWKQVSKRENKAEEK
jgi:hypothetical protein